MSFQAFTNQQGFHERHGDFFFTVKETSSKRGVIKDEQHGRRFQTERSDKSPTVRTSPPADGSLRPPTNYHRSAQRYRYTPGEVTSQRVEDDDTISIVKSGVDFNGPQHIHHPLCDGGIISTDAHQECKAKALARLAERKAGYGQMLAESRRTAQMLAGSGIHFLNLVRKLQPKNLPIFLRQMTSRDVADGYLSYQFGWRPLMSDIRDMMEVSKGQIQKPLVFSAYGTVRSSYDVSFRQEPHQVTGTIKHRDQCKIWARIDDPALHYAGQLGLADPLKLAWELVPYSFLVDWIVPVGSYLDSLTAANGLSFVQGFISQKQEARFKALGDPGTLDIDDFRFQRRVLNDFPSVGLYLRQGSPFSITRASEFAALLRQLRR